MTTFTMQGRKAPKALTITAFAAAVSLALSGCGGNAESDVESGTTGSVSEDCTPVHEFPTIEDGVLTVAAMNAAPKFHALSDSGPFEGIDATLITDFAEENCLEVLFKPMTGAAAQLDLSEGKSDLFGGLHVKTDERAEVFGQAEGYIIYDALGITSATEDSYDSIDALQGKKVGVLSGSFFAEPLKDALGAENVEEYQSESNAFEDLKAGRIDAAGNQSMMGFNFSNREDGYETVIFDEDPDFPELTALFDINWPHTKDVPEMTAAIDDYYMRAKEDGTVQEVLEENGVSPEVAEFYINGR